jgi:protein arginine kinase activator
MLKPKCQYCASEAKVFMIKGNEAPLGYCKQHALLAASAGAKAYSSEVSSMPIDRCGSLSCPRCHSSFELGVVDNALGCMSCYEAFREYLKPVLARFHKSCKHLGKIPRRALSLENVKEKLCDLEIELGQLVEAECFQDAALVKNSIKDFTDLMEELLNSPRKGQ